MKSYTSKTIHKLPEWVQVLIGWNMMGHVGMSIQALRAFVGADDVLELLDEVEKHPSTYAQFCHTVNAPIWSVRYNAIWPKKRLYQYDSYSVNDYSKGLESVNLLQGAKKSNKQQMWARVSRVFAKEYPDKKYVTLECMEGRTTFTRMTPDQVLKLSKIGSGAKTLFNTKFR